MDTIRKRVALVTGGASGIGRATVDRLASDEVTVVIGDIQDDAGEAAVRSSVRTGRRLHSCISMSRTSPPGRRL